MRIDVEQAAFLLQHDEVVAIPTETVYGLAASLYSERAIEKVFTLKNRPKANPLIIHVLHPAQALAFVEEKPPHLEELMHHFWPGPLTLVLPIRKDLIPATARAHLDTAAFRQPSHPLVEQLLEKISPLVAPSANISGKPSATRYEHIENDFGIDFPVLDGGPCHHGVESTILAFVDNRWELARHGAISIEAIRKVLGSNPLIQPRCKHKKPISPGQMFRHYAPVAHLYLSSPPHFVEAILGFKDRSYPDNSTVYFLGDSQSPEEVSHNLYRILRQLDEDGVEEAVVDMNFPRDGLWITIRERLEKAASKN